MHLVFRPNERSGYNCNCHLHHRTSHVGEIIQEEIFDALVNSLTKYPDANIYHILQTAANNRSLAKSSIMERPYGITIPLKGLIDNEMEFDFRFSRIEFFRNHDCFLAINQHGQNLPDNVSLSENLGIFNWGIKFILFF